MLYFNYKKGALWSPSDCVRKKKRKPAAVLSWADAPVLWMRLRQRRTGWSGLAIAKYEEELCCVRQQQHQLKQPARTEQWSPSPRRQARRYVQHTHTLIHSNLSISTHPTMYTIYHCVSVCCGGVRVRAIFVFSLSLSLLNFNSLTVIKSNQNQTKNRRSRPIAIVVLVNVKWSLLSQSTKTPHKKQTILCSLLCLSVFLFTSQLLCSSWSWFFPCCLSI